MFYGRQPKKSEIAAMQRRAARASQAWLDGLEVKCPHLMEEKEGRELYDAACKKLYPDGISVETADGHISKEDPGYPWSHNHDPELNKREARIFVVVGKNLGTDNPEILGLADVNYFRSSQTGLLCYQAIDEGQKYTNRDGLLKHVVNMAHRATSEFAKSEGQELKALFTEAEKKDISTFEKMTMSARKVLSNFFQPIDQEEDATGKKQNIQRKFSLYSWDASGCGFETKLETVRAFIKDYYETLGTPLTNKYFVQMMDKIQHIENTIKAYGVREKPARGKGPKPYK